MTRFCFLLRFHLNGASFKGNHARKDARERFPFRLVLHLGMIRNSGTCGGYYGGFPSRLASFHIALGSL